MKKIGILFGNEKNFPQTLIEKINTLAPSRVLAESIVVGAVRIDQLPRYSVLFDRVSNAVPYYRSILKLAALHGSHIVNNPFWKCADDNFFNAVLAQHLGIKVPKTAIIPSKEMPEGTGPATMRNLEYPLDWDYVFDYVGFPCIIKPNLGTGAFTSYKVYNPNEFFSTYDLTGQKLMIVQEAIEYDSYYRVYTVGFKHTKIMTYFPEQPMHLRYSPEEPQIETRIKEEITDVCIKLCKSLGFDFNAIEIAVKDGQIYVMDCLNPNPNADKEFLKDINFDWLTDVTAEYLVDLALAEPKSVPVNLPDFLA
jgi:glutathione synthase/RimK-type ligase-like ATP-grasp enzyme